MLDLTYFCVKVGSVVFNLKRNMFMKTFMEYFWILIIGNSLVWGIIFLGSLLPNTYILILLGCIAGIIGSVVYNFIIFLFMISKVGYNE